MIELVPPQQKIWRERFLSEQAVIRSVLNGHTIAIEHIGSTSVGDIWAKDIVDVAVLVASTAIAEQYRCRFESVGYTWLGHGSHADTGRRVVSRVEDNHTRTRIHIFPSGHDGFYALVQFRDKLRAHPQLAKKYEILKRSLVKRVEGNPQNYHEGKTSFILDSLGNLSD